MSCAARNLTEFARWTDPAKMLKATPGLLDSRAPFITYTAVQGGDKGDYGDRLMEFINLNGFGQVTKVGPEVNHTGNKVALYVWVVNYDAIIGWFHQDRQKLEGGANGNTPEAIPQAAA